MKFNIASLDMEILKGGENEPMFSYDSTAVTDGTNAYLIDAREPAGGKEDIILQFNPVTNSRTAVEVDDFPYVDKMRYNDPPANVFVEKLNRIYYFGGAVNKDIYNPTAPVIVDDIWFIDLSPLGLTEPTVPTTATTPASTSTYLPDVTDCTAGCMDLRSSLILCFIFAILGTFILF